MDITNTVLWEEIQQARDTGENPVHFNYRIEIDTGEQLIHPRKLLSLDVTRQYNSRFADEIIATILMGEGSFSNLLYPHRDEFDVTLIKEPLTESKSSDNFARESRSRRYRGSLVENRSNKITGEHAQSSYTEDADRAGDNEYHIQLIDLAAEQLRLKNVGGVYRNMRAHEVIQGVLSMTSADLDLDRDSAILGVDVIEGDNQQQREHTIIPHGTRSVDVAPYIQQQVAGVYRTGMGYYLQNGIWYIYPQFNTRRFDKTDRNLTVVNIPPNRMPSIERTYFTDGDRVILIATGETTHIDDSEAMQLNLGNAVRFVKAENVIEDFHEVDGNTATAERAHNIEELVVRQRRVGLNVAHFSPDRILANEFQQLSDIARRIGSFIRTQWEESNPDLIYPGMPVRYVYQEGEILEEIFGIVMGVDHYVYDTRQGAVTGRYRCDAILTLFLETTP